VFLRPVVLALTLLSIVPTLKAADDAWWGTWKLNIQKSIFNPGPPYRSNTHIYQPWGTNGMKATAHVVTADGKNIDFTYAVKYDGKYYPVNGDPTRDLTSLRRVDAYTFVGSNKKNGKVVTSSRHVLSKDGRTIVVTIEGRGIHYVRVYEKQ